MNKGITRLHFDWWVSLSESLSDGILNSPAANFCHDLVVKNHNLSPVRCWMDENDLIEDRFNIELCGVLASEMWSYKNAIDHMSTQL